MNKKIAFFMSSLKIAGVEKALVNYINFIYDNFKNVTIDLYLLRDTGALKRNLDARCKVRAIKISDNDLNLLFLGGFKQTLIYYFKKMQFLKICKIVWRRIFLRKLDFDLINFEQIENLSNKYDTAICYMSHMPFLIKYVCEKVSAKRKVMFVHSDFKANKYHLEYFQKYVKQFDYVCCVSEDLKNQFLELYKGFSDRCFVLHNYIDFSSFDRLSNEPINLNKNNNDDTKIILTVGNFTKPKGHKVALKVAKTLKKDKFKFKWYFIGDGPLLKTIKRKAKSLNEQIFFYGLVDNPFPFYKKCDLYVQTSLSEGYCTTVLEARYFQLPIVTTDVSGMDEILDNYNGAYIVKSKNVKGLANSIKLASLCNAKKLFCFNSAKYLEDILAKTKEALNI